MISWETYLVEEDVELPDFLYELDSDEMVEWLSEISKPQNKYSFEFERPHNKSTRDAIIDHFIVRLLSNERIEPLAMNYVVGNLKLLLDGKPAFLLKQGREKVDDIDHRWRVCVARYIYVHGATQSQIAEIIGISERQVNEWLRYAKVEIRSYSHTEEFIRSLVGKPHSFKEYRESIIKLNDHRRIIAH